MLLFDRLSFFSLFSLHLSLTHVPPPAGKNWHDDKKPFRPNAGLTSYAKRAELRKQHEAVKEHEKELKEEKEAERQVRI